MALEAERDRLVASLQGTHLDLKMFVPLLIKYQLGGDFPSGHATRYRHEEALGRDGLTKLDDTNRAHLAAYIDNVHAMEAITRINTNLALLRMHREKAEEAGGADVPLVRSRDDICRLAAVPRRPQRPPVCVPRRASSLSGAAVLCAQEAEMVGLRLGDMVLTTFPGELSVRIGLKLKASSPHPVSAHESLASDSGFGFS